jgi:hypothetical protein
MWYTYKNIYNIYKIYMNSSANKTKNFSLFLCSFMWNIESRLIQKSSRWNYTFRRVRKVPKSHHQLRHVCLSVRMEQLGPHWTEFFEIWDLEFFFSKTCRQNRSFIKIWKNNLILSWKRSLYTFIIIIFRQSILKMRNVSDGSCRGNQNTNFPFNNISENCAVCEIMWKNVV